MLTSLSVLAQEALIERISSIICDMAISASLVYYFRALRVEMIRLVLLFSTFAFRVYRYSLYTELILFWESL